MTRRPGLSLTEVLVALFIMGIGCIAILTLFPLGALNMAQAFRDDRCTQGASQADASLRSYVKTARDTGRLNSEKFVEALTNPDSTRSATNHMVQLTAAMRFLPEYPFPSYPVFIDPLGYRARGGTNDTPSPVTDRTLWLGDNGFGYVAGGHGSAVPRRSLGMITKLNANATETAKQQPLAIRTCSLLDGFGYDLNGQPATVGGGTTIDRDLRYNWLWVLQKPDAETAPTTVTVVVFDKRAPGYAPTGVPLETVWKPEVAAEGQTLVSFKGSYDNGTLPPVQRGGWLMDCSIALIDRSSGTPTAVNFDPNATGRAATVRPWIRNAQFYRVVSVTENVTLGGIDVELEAPLRPDTGRHPGAKPAEPQLQTDQRRFLYLSGAAEVFERPLTLDIN
jgi:hypothetical protein